MWGLSSNGIISVPGVPLYALVWKQVQNRVSIPSVSFKIQTDLATYVLMMSWFEGTGGVWGLYSNGTISVSGVPHMPWS